ncbi:MAG: hypothetical protein IPM23_04440 [Candidatus Melainabacteria bacterium]|nr:hypothetical protein [Candidatus Melainabacteria bacterium]
MSLTLLAGILLLAQLGLLAATMWLRYLSNKSLFKTASTLAPVRSKNVFFGAFSGLYDFLDRIPGLRRSGTANEFDLLKAMLITVVPIMALQLAIYRPSALIALLSVNFLLFLVNITILAHPVTKRLVGRR